MGWLVLFILPAILQKTGLVFGILMLAGGLSYTIGALFLRQEKALFPYDLASLYPTSFGTAIYRHCLLYVIRKQLLVKLEAVS